MAIINCPECSKQVSDKAPACPNCGYPIADSIAENLQPSRTKSKQVIPEIPKQQPQIPKQVTPQAIEATFNKQLNPKNITAKVALRDSCLQVLLESKQSLPQSPVVNGIKKFLTTINPAGIEKVKIYYKQLGDDFPKWDEEIELTTSIPKAEEVLPSVRNIKKAIEKEISTLPELQKKVQNLVDPMNFSVKVETSEDLSFRKTLHIELTRTFPSSSKPNYAELYLEIKSLTSVVIAKEFNDLQVIATFQGKKEWQKRDSLYYIELNKTEKSVVDLSIENTNDRAREHYESVKGAIELRKQSSIVNRAELEEPIIPEIIQSTVQQNQYQESRPINYEPQLRCPKCSSTQLMPTKKGYSLGKAVVGGLLTGGVGLLGGFWGSNDIRLNCLNCGHKWQPK